MFRNFIEEKFKLRITLQKFQSNILTENLVLLKILMDKKKIN